MMRIGALAGLVLVSLLPATALAQSVSCRDTVACEDLGRCDDEDGRCVATKVEDCRASTTCREDGLCGLDRAQGTCVLDDYGCSHLKACSELGLCGAREGRCVPRVSTDCERSQVCRTEGRCFGSLDGTSCLVNGTSSQDACSESEACAREGRCAAAVIESIRQWTCAPDSDAACAQSRACQEWGQCSMKIFDGRGICVAANDSDCSKSKQCNAAGTCFADAGVCLTRADDERRNAPNFETLLGPDVLNLTPDELRDELYFGSEIGASKPGGPRTPQCQSGCDVSCLDSVEVRKNEFQSPKCVDQISAFWTSRVSRLVHFTDLKVSLDTYDADDKSFDVSLVRAPAANFEGRPKVLLGTSAGETVRIQVPVDPAFTVSFRRDATEFLRAEVVGQIESEFINPTTVYDPTSRRHRRETWEVDVEVLGVRVYDARDGRVFASTPRSLVPRASASVPFELQRLGPNDAAIIVLMEPCLDPKFWPRKGCPHLRDRWQGRLYFVGDACPFGACPLAVGEPGNLSLPEEFGGDSSSREAPVPKSRFRVHHARVPAGEYRVLTDHFPQDRRQGVQLKLAPGEVLVLQLEKDTKTFRPLPLTWSRALGALVAP